MAILQGRRYFGADDEHLHLGAFPVEVRDIFYLQGLQAPVDLLLQPVVGQEELISGGGDGKAGGHRQLRQVGGDFPQVGHFAAHRLGQSLVDLPQPQNQFPNVGELVPLQNGADLCSRWR